MPRNYKMHVWEVQQAAQAILQFTKGKTLHDYATDWVLRSAVERQINKIGGALARLIVNDDPTARRIGGYGGILGWGKMLEPYDSPDEEREVWDFVQNNLPSLFEDTTAVLEEGPADQAARGKSQRRKIIPLVARRTSQIRNLCQRHHVKRLDVFGSAVNGDFRPDESDIDFLVEFDDSVEGQRFETRFQLSEELEALFGRSVDLVDDSAIQNPYFRDEVDQTREPVYEAQQSSSPSHSVRGREQAQRCSQGMPGAGRKGESPLPRWERVRVRVIGEDGRSGYPRSPAPNPDIADQPPAHR